MSSHARHSADSDLESIAEGRSNIVDCPDNLVRHCGTWHFHHNSSTLELTVFNLPNFQ